MRTKVDAELQELPACLRFIAERLLQQSVLRPEQVRDLLTEAQVRPDALGRWADFDHPVADGYGRKLAYRGPHFEIMVMSWAPGDYSAIHDHGGAQWGAVQVFGPAEHACFRIFDGRLWTHARRRLEPGSVVTVTHDMVHQMGNPSDARFLSLHVYGAPAPSTSVTADARVFDVARQRIVRVDGGVFFALPSEDAARIEEGPTADPPALLRELTEQLRRIGRMESESPGRYTEALAAAGGAWSSPDLHQQLVSHALGLCDARAQVTDSRAWAILNVELEAAARLHEHLGGSEPRADRFHRYAEIYDAVIGRPCLQGFMAAYLERLVSQWAPRAAGGRWLSIGCGTGLVEQHLADAHGVGPDRMLGIDVSAAMVEVARRRTSAIEADILAWESNGQRFDVAYSGLNVFHYLDHLRFAEAVHQTAQRVAAGGVFVGDFITPDHVRWYPNVMVSEDACVASFRTPRLANEDGFGFQDSDIINLDCSSGRLRVDHAGIHRRYLPSVVRVRQTFERHFPGGVELHDAHSLDVLPTSADTCPSTRYVLVARK